MQINFDSKLIQTENGVEVIKRIWKRDARYRKENEL